MRKFYANVLDWIDQNTGLTRSWGLVLYASLPSCLAIIDVLEIKITEFEFGFEHVLFSVIPISVLYVLIHNKYHGWFIDLDKIHLRTLISLIIILLISTSICGLSLLVKGEYQLNLSSQGFIGVGKSYLMAISSLVLSSVLFLASLTKSSNLPGLPHSKMSNFIESIRSRLLRIQRAEICNVDEDELNQLLEIILSVERDIDESDIPLKSRMSGKEINRLSLEIKKVREVITILIDKELPARKRIVSKLMGETGSTLGSLEISDEQLDSWNRFHLRHLGKINLWETK